jgi:cyclophilin family peptidyl-prolyl cis-trans isomerase
MFAVLALALAACGDDDDSGGGAAGEDAAGTVAEGCPPADGSADRVTSFDQAPPMCIDTSKDYTATIATNLGDLTIELDVENAPSAVNNFVVLARYHYYDDTPCHRIIPEFMAQCGDPTGTGTGGPGYAFADELPASSDAYVHGAVAMANSGPNTQGSQFFTVTAPDGYPLQPDYTVFGQVVDSDETLDALNAAGNPDPGANGVPPAEEVTIESVTIAES